MNSIIEHIRTIYEERLEDFPFLKKKASDKVIDKNGKFSRSLAKCNRYIGIANAILTGEKCLFEKKLKLSVKLYIDLTIRYENSEPISKSYVSILRYQEIFDALAGGDMQLAKEFAQIVGGRPEIEKEFDHPFDIALGYALKAIVLETEDVVARLAAFRDQLSKKGNKSFKGFVEAFEAIHKKDSEAFEASLNEIIRCYPGLRKGVFDHSLDAHLCVWGIGLINLAKHKGMVVEFDHELMPEELQLD